MGIPLAPVSLRVRGRSFCSDLPVFDGRRSAVMAFRARYSEVVTRFRNGLHHPDRQIGRYGDGAAGGNL